MTAGQYVALALLSILVAILADIAAGGDAEYIGQNANISHLWGSRLRGVALALPALSFHATELQWGQSLPLSTNLLLLAATVGRIALLGLYLAAIFWAWFDLRLNLRRPDVAWDYIGKDKETASSDTSAAHLLRGFKYPGRVYFAIKVAALLLLLGAFIAAH